MHLSRPQDGVSQLIMCLLTHNKHSDAMLWPEQGKGSLTWVLSSTRISATRVTSTMMPSWLLGQSL